MTRAILVMVCIVAFRTPALAQAPSVQPMRTIANVTGDLYTVQDGPQVTVFLVTADGIILGDPLSRATALWLREELAARFPGVPVKYVLHTHHQFGRAAGAGVFDATAQVVGHANFNSELKQAQSAQPALYRDVLPVESDFRSRRTIMLGGKTVQLLHVTHPDARDMTALFFADERVVFAVDNPPVDTSPLFGRFTPRNTRSWLRIVAALDFDVMLSGRGETIPAAPVVALARYVEDLMDGLMEGYVAGRSLAELQTAPMLESHRDEPHYAQRYAQMAVIYSQLSLTTAHVYGAAVMNYLGRQPGYCSSYATCDPAGGTARAGAMGVMIQHGPLGAVAEIRAGDQFHASRTSELLDDEFAHRDTLGSILFKLSPVARGPVTFGLLAGPSVVVSDTRGINFVRNTFPPSGGFHRLEFRRSAPAFTVGTDVVASLGSHVSVIVPVRLTHIWRDPGSPAGSFDVHAGVGLAVTVFRYVR